jgi:L-fuculose-phosphate aldolase
MQDTRDQLARDIIDACVGMEARGLNQGTAGNVSARWAGGFLVTPTGVPPRHLEPRDIVHVGMDGRPEPGLRPSSEWRLHRDIYASRPEARAVVHAHPDYCTALACARRGIPAFHYVVAIAGGPDIRCSDYATFGTQALSDAMLAALAGRRACLLANHGMVCFADDVPGALGLALEVETLARQYWLACQAGPPVLLDAEEMARVLAAFETYGRQED